MSYVLKLEKWAKKRLTKNLSPIKYAKSPDEKPSLKFRLTTNTPLV